MTYILLDESGDLGFSFDKGSSRYFVMAVIVTEDIRRLEKIARTVHKGISKKHKVNDLHSYHDEPITRKRFLKRLAKTDCEIFSVALDKRKLNARQDIISNDLYNKISCTLIEYLFQNKREKLTEPVVIIASKRERSFFKNKKFNESVTHTLESIGESKIRIEISTPSRDKSLQAVDFVSWAIFHKFESGDPEYYDIIAPRQIDPPFLLPCTTKPYPLFRAALR